MTLADVAIAILVSAGAAQAASFTDFLSDPNIAGNWTNTKYFSATGTATWNAGDQDLDLAAAPGANRWSVLNKTGETRAVGDPVSLDIKSLSATGGSWSVLGLTVSTGATPSIGDGVGVRWTKFHCVSSAKPHRGELEPMISSQDLRELDVYQEGTPSRSSKVVDSRIHFLKIVLTRRSDFLMRPRRRLTFLQPTMRQGSFAGSNLKKPMVFVFGELKASRTVSSSIARPMRESMWFVSCMAPVTLRLSSPSLNEGDMNYLS